MTRKEARAPCRNASDWRFEVLSSLSYSGFCRPHHKVLSLQWLREDILGHSEWKGKNVYKNLP